MPSDQYQRVIETIIPQERIKVDTTLGFPIYYIEDHLYIDSHPNKNILRETNLKFLKILIRNDLVIQTNENGCIAVEFTEQKISNVIANIEWHYKQDWFHDSDLHDDIFEHFQVISPTLAYSPTLSQEFINRNFNNFIDITITDPATQEAEARKYCTQFLRDRSKLFCLYIFLRRCAILHRDTNYVQPFLHLLNFLSIKSNLTFLKKKLRAETFVYAGDILATGLHEWLERALIIPALKRTAGYFNDITPTATHILPVQGYCSLNGSPNQFFIFSEFNWLDFQFLIRNQTKDIIFPHNMNGHIGAVFGGLLYDSYGLALRAKTKGGYRYDPSTQQTTWIDITTNDPFLCQDFNANINDFFYQSNNIWQLMTNIHHFFETKLLHDQTINFQPARTPSFFPDALHAHTYDGVNARKAKLKEAHDLMKIWFRDLYTQSYLLTINQAQILTFHYREDSVLPEIPPTVTTMHLQIQPISV